MARSDIVVCWEADTHAVLEELAHAEKVIASNVPGFCHDVLRRYELSFNFGALRCFDLRLDLLRPRNFRSLLGALAKAGLGPA